MGASGSPGRRSSPRRRSLAGLTGAGEPLPAAPGAPSLARPLPPLLLAFALGIALSSHLPASVAPGWLYLAAALLGLALAANAAWGRRSLLLPPALFLVAGLAAGETGLSAQGHTDGQSPLQGQRVVLSGTVLSAEECGEGAHRLVVEVSEAEDRGVSGRLLLWVRGEGGLPGPGERIRFRARPQPIRNYGNPGCYDLKRKLAGEAIYSRAHAEPADIERLGHDDSWRLYLPRLRADIAGLFRERLSAQAHGLCLALATGSRAALPREVQESFAATGTAHLLSVSGLHLSLVGLLAYLLLRRLLRSERLLLRVPAQYVAATLAFTVVLLYALLVGWREPAVRSALMAGAALVVLLSGRETDLWSALALAALIILALSPASLLEPSFQLSFAAVAGIALAARRLGNLRQRLRLPRPLAWAAGLLAVSLAATLATGPIGAYYFNQVSLIGPVANLAAVPLIGTLLTPLCLGAALLLPLSPALATLPLTLAEPLANLSLAVVSWLGGLPWASFTVPTPDAFEVALLYAGLLALARLRGKRLAAALVLVAVAWPLHGRWADSLANPPGRLSVRYLDMGRGNCALAVLPTGEAVLIDAGGSTGEGFAGGGFDPGRAVIARTLWALRVRRLAAVVITHPHPDHTCGLPYVLAHFSPREVWTGEADPELEQAARSAGCRLVRLSVGDKRDIGGVRLEVLWPPRGGVAIKDGDRPGFAVQASWDAENERSLVLRLGLGQRRFLFPGDIGMDSETALLEAAAPLASDVLLAAHHGSRRSNCPEFLASVGCREVVLSRGPGTYAWPSREVLERLRRAGARVWRTDERGMITAATDGRSLSLSGYLAP